MHNAFLFLCTSFTVRGMSMPAERLTASHIATPHFADPADVLVNKLEVKRVLKLWVLVEQSIRSADLQMQEMLMCTV